MEKQRKFLLIIPLLVIPFMTMAFWALGGGKNNHAPVAQTKGLDMNLPEAQFKDQKTKNNKMAVYQQNNRDSVQNDGVSKSFLTAMGLNKKSDSVPSTEDQTQRIQQKLAQLNHQISQPIPATQPSYEPEQPDVKQLHKMMKSMNSSGGRDPEMQQLNKMLDKIQAIQNPGSVKTKATKTTNAPPFRAISAIIDGKQKVKDGSAVKLKLTDTVTLKHQFLPKGQEIFGICQITNQRLLLNIENIRLGKQIIPVSLTVFSLDGMPGIPAPEAELGGAVSGGADNALQSMQFLTMDQSIGAQAAAGGVNAARGLFSKKVKKIKVKLKNEYPVLLKINK